MNGLKTTESILFSNESVRSDFRGLIDYLIEMDGYDRLCTPYVLRMYRVNKFKKKYFLRDNYDHDE